MEIILAIVVAAAVIFFGALISMGNEQQRKAIDGLQEQVMLWAVQDLKIKRKHLEQTVQVPDPVAWLNQVVGKSSGIHLQLQVITAFDEPQALVCTTDNGDRQVVFTTYSPDQIQQYKNEKQARLSHVIEKSPLLSVPRKAKSYEISPLNGGILFDLELPVVWHALTGQSAGDMERIWMYMFC